FVETLFEEFTEHLREAEKANECRYGLFDFCCRDSAGHPRQGIVFIAWSPENAKTKEKMVYASSRDALQKKFDGVKVIIQATDYDEIDKDVVEKELVRKLYS
ncbi:actin-depolymerizing factor 3-like, partial [Lingula anatina]|uniref:Actin-depolymerizing factor 3-like n=1 Tax=Lingula anatina TaxID=7574 RepID=A0A1S3IH39_LINAN